MNFFCTWIRKLKKQDMNVVALTNACNTSCFDQQYSRTINFVETTQNQSNSTAGKRYFWCYLQAKSSAIKFTLTICKGIVCCGRQQDFDLPCQYWIWLSWDSLTRVEGLSKGRSPWNHAQQSHQNERRHLNLPCVRELRFNALRVVQSSCEVDVVKTLPSVKFGQDKHLAEQCARIRDP